ncbi:hypothetical protein IMZ48_26930 [Candidatus Bathyarchaeota archaeon]|nr:hypothetical protein [Candidatus Bathyarchaeota archaeon]
MVATTGRRRAIVDHTPQHQIQHPAPQDRPLQPAASSTRARQSPAATDTPTDHDLHERVQAWIDSQDGDQAHESLEQAQRYAAGHVRAHEGDPPRLR